MITKKRKISQIPSTTVLTQDSKILVIHNNATATISALDIIGGISTISASHLNSYDNPHNVTKDQVGLSNADNTSDLNKPVSNATLAALATKQNTLVSGTTIKTINGVSILGAGDITISSSVTTVNSKTGNVVLDTTDIPEGGNLYYTNTRVQTFSDARYVALAGSYTNPSWLVGIDWSKISGKPNTLGGYGIIDPVVLTTNVYVNPAWIQNLSWGKLTDVPYFVTQINDLSDVNVSSPTIGQVLKWSGTQWINDSNDPVNELSFLDDVLLSGLSTNDLLQYNGTKWTNTVLSDIVKWGGISGSILDQTDLQTALGTKADAADFSNVDNTSDLNKPISTATQVALNNQETLSIVYAIALG